ncbi:hypothetical protein GCM10011316_06740 [Roseibium aquae]|uniref:Flagellin-like hook-associated protein FlgL n=1 Tax=Roseibium aquae TaxID=1323746 RepID=A0A916WVH9_9HYPH|nr:flagellar protein [Roseibium aquae]GGB37277.1 hypothetical protein GCM10011316_06740 [Roseibium aquae]
MTIDTITTSRSYLTQQLTKLNRTLSEKTAQLATGMKSQTYGGLGDNRLLSLELTQKVSRIDAYQETIIRTNLHINSLNTTLERLEALRIDSKSALDQNDFELQSDGQTQTQATAEVLLYEAVSLLNTEVAGYYLYGGTDAFSNPVAGVAAIMDGADGRAGLKTVVDEYVQANLGADDLGRLTVSALTTNGAPPTDSTFTIAEDGTHDFGFDIAGVTNALSNVAVTGPAGTGTDPDTFDIQFTGQPIAGEEITLQFTLPPGHTENLSMTFKASTGNNPLTGEFAIGADLAETAANLRTAILTEIEEQAKTSLKAAATTWAADEFFDTFGGNDTLRVDGPPFDTATAQVSGAATTVAWYTGENTATSNARLDKNARVDDNLEVSYGARANEQGFADVMKGLAAFVAADFSAPALPTNPTQAQIDANAAEQAQLQRFYNGLTERLRAVLEPSSADQSGIVDISTEISIAYRTVQYTDDRHTQVKSSYETTIGEIVGVNDELLAAEILQLQTNIEASYRASSIVFDLTLADYV